MTKLTDKKIRYICRHADDIGDWTTERLARQYDVSPGRTEVRWMCSFNTSKEDIMDFVEAIKQTIVER